MRTLTIDGVRVADDTDAYVIAEIGHNHQGRLDLARRLIQCAHEAGASAVKLQKRDNRSLFTREMWNRPYRSSTSFGRTYGEHREALELTPRDYVELLAFARDLGVTLFATAFDVPSADVLAALDMPAIKIGSGDLTNTPLLVHVARLGRPMIVSTGGASLEDVERAVAAIRPYGVPLAVLQCTSAYPARNHELNLSVITSYRERFPDAVIGLSSHDPGIDAACTACALGARVVEKHFTLDRTMKGTDHAFSLEPADFARLVRRLRSTRESLGDGIKRPLPTESAALAKMGKRLVAARELPAGHVLGPDDVAVKSPNGGLPPYRIEEILGKTVRCPLSPDDAIDPGVLEDCA